MRDPPVGTLQLGAPMICGDCSPHPKSMFNGGVAGAQECSIGTRNYRGGAAASALARAPWQEIRRWHQKGLCVC